jgi:signal transduction histidine kinase
MFFLPLYTAVLLSISQTVLIIGIGFELFNIKLNIKKSIFISFIMVGITYFLRQLPLAGFHTIILVLLLTTLITVICKIRLWSSFICSLLGCIVLGTVENIILPIFLLLINKEITDLAGNPWLNVILFIPTLILLTVIYTTIHKRKIVLFDLCNKNTKPEILNIISVITIILQTFIILTISHMMLSSSTRFPLSIKTVIFDLFVVFMCILSILSLKKAGKNAQEIIELNMVKTHLNQIEVLMNNLSSQRHEFNRHIQVIQSMVYLELYEETRAYLRGITENPQRISAGKLINTGHPTITSIINTKHILAESMGIKFVVSITCDLSGIDMKSWDLCSILGNVIDNAIEAASLEKADPRVAVEFKLLDKYHIYVHNNGVRIADDDYDHLFEPGYTTKESEGRGFGLYLTKKLLTQYNGEIEVIPGQETCFVLKIPNRGYVNDISNF